MLLVAGDRLRWSTMLSSREAAPQQVAQWLRSSGPFLEQERLATQRGSPISKQSLRRVSACVPWQTCVALQSGWVREERGKGGKERVRLDPGEGRQVLGGSCILASTAVSTPKYVSSDCSYLLADSRISTFEPPSKLRQQARGGCMPADG